MERGWDDTQVLKALEYLKFKVQTQRPTYPALARRGVQQARSEASR